MCATLVFQEADAKVELELQRKNPYKESVDRKSSGYDTDLMSVHGEGEERRMGRFSD